MADLEQSLVLQKGLDTVKAFGQFEAFVKNTGGNQETVNRDRDFFDQWTELQEDVRFTRELGTSGVMRALVLTGVMRGTELQNTTERPQPR